MITDSEFSQILSDAITAIWEKEIKEDYMNGWLLKEDTLKNGLYFHLRNRLGALLDENNIRIFTEYKFLADSYIVGDSYRCAWAIKEYPPSTEEQAILSQLADRNGVTLRIYHRLVEPMEQRQIVNNANRKNRLMSGDNDLNQAIEAEGTMWTIPILCSAMDIQGG